jgi:hypothetical protein
MMLPVYCCSISLLDGSCIVPVVHTLRCLCYLLSSKHARLVLRRTSEKNRPLVVGRAVETRRILSGQTVHDQAVLVLGVSVAVSVVREKRRVNNAMAAEHYGAFSTADECL